MNRRRLVLALAASSLPLAACSDGPLPAGFADLAAARRRVEALGERVKSRGHWRVAQVLHHAAQSVEYSMQGFPQLKPALFQATVGRSAFAFFSWRGQMRHALDEPIPGAPALPAADAPLAPAVARLSQALHDFERYPGRLAPHFAYGALDRPQYVRAHLLHLAEHWTEFQDEETLR